MQASPNPFGALSLIAAPAVLTNACSVLILSTANRLARAVDRARLLTAEIERASQAGDTPHAEVRELASAERRALLLLQALRCFYVALGGFALSAFLSLVGAVLAPRAPGVISRPMEVIALATGLVAVGALVTGTVVLVRETRIAVDTLQLRAKEARARLSL